jgi:hypothetical protein
MKWFDWVALLLVFLVISASLFVGLPFWNWPPAYETSPEFAIGLRLAGGFAMLGAYYWLRSIVAPSISEFRAGLSDSSGRE